MVEETVDDPSTQITLRYQNPRPSRDLSLSFCINPPRAAKSGDGLNHSFHVIEYRRNAGWKQDAGEFVMIRGGIREKANKNEVFRFELRKKRRLGRLGPRRMRRRLNREKGEKREGREKFWGARAPPRRVRRVRRRVNREKGEKREGREKVLGLLVPRPGVCGVCGGG